MRQGWRTLLQGMLSILMLGFGTTTLQAFPEMIRHGYASCVSCHVSPAGGGLLTDYGRELSRELLATWGTEQENKPLYGVPLPESIKLGGDFRAIQTYRDTPRVREGRFFLMQADVEGAWLGEKGGVVVSAGFDPGSPLTHDDDKWTSHKHYGIAQLNSLLVARVGRFQRNYGLMIPDHSSQIRRGLGFDQGTETYNAELNLIDEAYNASLTYVGGRPDDKTVSSEKGVLASAVGYFKGSFKLGGSYFFGKTSSDVGRELYGPFWVLGFTEKLYWMGEADWVRVAPKGSDLIEGWVTYNRIGYELFRGFDLYSVQQSTKKDRRQDKLDFMSYGLGLQWSPRPHWVLNGQWEKVQNPARSAKFSDSAYFIFHFFI